MILEGIYLSAEETVIRKETDSRFDAVWKVIDVQEEEERAKDGPLWDSRISFSDYSWEKNPTYTISLKNASTVSCI